MSVVIETFWRISAFIFLGNFTQKNFSTCVFERISLTFLKFDMELRVLSSLKKIPFLKSHML